MAGQLVRLHGIDAPELDQTFWSRGQLGRAMLPQEERFVEPTLFILG